MATLDDYIFTPCQGENAPIIDETKYTEVNRVDLKTLPEDTIVTFSGAHPASNYMIQVLGTPQEEREIKIWYSGSNAVAWWGPICHVGPGSGCLKTKAKNLESFTIEEIAKKEKSKKGILELKKNYTIIEFAWDDQNQLYPKYEGGQRLEYYTSIKIPKELVK